MKTVFTKAEGIKMNSRLDFGSTKDLINEISKQTSISIIHSWQEDEGFRAAESRNKAIAKAGGEYIIVIDGDIILHKDFIKVVEDSRGSKLKDPEKNNIFTGEFWTGKTALGLGLIDGIGNADQILKEKFGEKVIIKNFEKPKGFIARKLSSSIPDPVDKITNIIEEKSMWQKFGL